MTLVATTAYTSLFPDNFHRAASQIPATGYLAQSMQPGHPGPSDGDSTSSLASDVLTLIKAYKLCKCQAYCKKQQKWAATTAQIKIYEPKHTMDWQIMTLLNSGPTS
jgi:hypothetical protein